jgi:Tfp pilus assembly protein PilF
MWGGAWAEWQCTQRSRQGKASHIDVALLPCPLTTTAAHYQRALSILDFVQGGSAADQGEVDANKVAVLWNMGAVHLAQAEYGACVAKCSQALELEPDSIRVLLRRAKAYVGRGEYGAAEADLSRVKDLEPWSFDAEDVMMQLRAARQKHSRAQSQFAAAALGK